MSLAMSSDRALLTTVSLLELPRLTPRHLMTRCELWQLRSRHKDSWSYRPVLHKKSQQHSSPS